MPSTSSLYARIWIDDMYMITSLPVPAYRATKDTKYLDRAAKALGPAGELTISD